MKPKVIIILALSIISLIFILQNSKVVTIQLLFWTVSASRIIMILGLLFIGFVVGFLLGRK
ncbi:MAG: LapA family protein [Candidatus Aminicenantes bacterium]|nr:LapA family protein [Candidatus Aminicenantes bacterium]HHF52667.1 LapA family protein [Candidatus Aminicenantes bacterium]